MPKNGPQVEHRDARHVLVELSPWQPCSSARAPLLSCVRPPRHAPPCSLCLQMRTPELPEHSLASPLSLPRSLVLRARSGTRPPWLPPRARAWPPLFFLLQAPRSPESSATGFAYLYLASCAPSRLSFAACSRGRRCRGRRGRLCARPGQPGPPPAKLSSPACAHGTPGPPRHSTAAVDAHSRPLPCSTVVRKEKVDHARK